MENNKMMEVINETFKEDQEVFELVMYALSRLNLSDALIRALVRSDVAVQNIPPQTLQIVLRYENGLVMNKFYQEVFAPVKAQIMVDEIKLNTMIEYIKIGEKENNEHFMRSAKALMISRFDVLTTIAALWKGVAFAEEFDLKVRVFIQLDGVYKKFFDDRGI